MVNNNETVFKARYADETGALIPLAFRNSSLNVHLYTVASGFVATESVTLANITLPDQVFGQ